MAKKLKYFFKKIIMYIIIQYCHGEYVKNAIFIFRFSNIILFPKIIENYELSSKIIFKEIILTTSSNFSQKF